MTGSAPSIFSWDDGFKMGGEADDSGDGGRQSGTNPSCPPLIAPHRHRSVTDSLPV